MIKVLEGLDPRTAAGIMAEAALSLGYDSPPPGIADDEAEIVERVVSEARRELGLPAHDYAPETIHLIINFLDEESDKVLSPPDTKSALDRLAARGDLPTDLYDIVVIREVQKVYQNHFALERKIIEKAVQDPDREQHYGKGPDQPAMISLFLRTFRTKWPAKDFQSIIAAQRGRGSKLYVHQAWRIYPSQVNLGGVSTPIEYLERFANAFGAQIEVDGKRGSFFLSANGNPRLARLRASKHEATMSRFVQPGNKSDLIVGIDNTRYRRMLNVMRVPEEEMLDFQGKLGII